MRRDDGVQPNERWGVKLIANVANSCLASNKKSTPDKQNSTLSALIDLTKQQK